MKTKTCKQCGKEIQKGLNNVCSITCKNKLDKIKKEEKKQKESKKINTKKLYKENVTLAKKISKLRDGYICQWCGKSEPKKDIHGSHIINEARDHRLSTYEFNIIALCSHCHLNLWHKDPNLASEWFNNKYPGRYELLNKIHIENGKEGTIPKTWHLEENNRLKELLKEYENNGFCTYP